jgi:hypothetical protein
MTLGRMRPALAGLASVPVTLLGLVLVTFLIGRAMPIDPVIAIVGDHATPDVIARVRLQLGLDDPLWEQFAIYLRNLLHGDLGNSVMTSHPGHRGHRAFLSRDAGTGHRGDHRCGAARCAIRRIRRRAAGLALRSCGAGDQPDRPIGAGVRAGSALPAGILCQAGDRTRHWATGCCL